MQASHAGVADWNRNCPHASDATSLSSGLCRYLAADGADIAANIPKMRRTPPKSHGMAATQVTRFRPQRVPRLYVAGKCYRVGSKWMERTDKMRCDEVMTDNPKYCVPFDTVARAAKLMKTANIGCLPVCANRQSRKLVGIVTDRDLVVTAVADGLDPDRTKIQEAMTPKVFACRADDDIEKALDAMGRLQVRRIPVVDPDGALAGIISLADLAMRADLRDKTAEVLRAIFKPSSMRAG